MRNNCEREELTVPVYKDDLKELQNRIVYLIEGYKYFYLKEDEESKNISAACARIINYFKDHLLYNSEKKKVKLIQSKETASEDAEELKNVFKRADAFKEPKLMPRIVFDEFMNVFMSTEDDFSFSREHNDFFKVVFAAGAVSMHKDDIEAITEKPLRLTVEDRVSNIDLEGEHLDMVIDVLNDRNCSSEKKDDILVSLDFITDYLKMVNDDELESEYRMVDDISPVKVLKTRL